MIPIFVVIEDRLVVLAEVERISECRGGAFWGGKGEFLLPCRSIFKPMSSNTELISFPTPTELPFLP